LCIWHLAFGIWHLAFGIWHLTFGIWHLTFGIKHLAFGIGITNCTEEMLFVAEMPKEPKSVFPAETFKPILTFVIKAGTFQVLLTI
jgi:hypothetical protein